MPGLRELDQLKPVDLCCLEGEPVSSSLLPAFLRKGSDELAHSSLSTLDGSLSSQLLRFLAFLVHLEGRVDILGRPVRPLPLCVGKAVSRSRGEEGPVPLCGKFLRGRDNFSQG